MPRKSAIALFVCLSAFAQQWKNQDEYNLFQTIVQSIRGGDYNATLGGLDKWKTQFPDSELRETRLELYIVTYTALKRPREVVDTAAEILKKFPNKQIALAAIVDSIYQLPKSPADFELAERAARTLIDRADVVYAKENRPPDMTDDAAAQAKKAIQPFAHRTLGWIFVQGGEFEKAIPELIKTLELDPNDVKASMMLGQSYAQQRKIELRPLVIFHYARAATHEGPGAFGEADRKSMLSYAASQYRGYRGSDDGFDRVAAAAKANALPPADFHIDSAEEIARREAEEQRKEEEKNPTLALWRTIRTALLKENGPEFFENNLKDALLPGGVNGLNKLKGKLVSARRAGKKMELVVAVENPTGDAILQLDQPIAGALDSGTEIAFEGVVGGYTKDPYSLRFDVERSKVEVIR